MRWEVVVINLFYRRKELDANGLGKEKVYN